MVRLGGADAMNQIAADNNFSVPDVIEAGQKVDELVALEPFQDGFLGAGWDAPDGESGTMASGGAAMDLMGQWAPGAFKNQAGVDARRSDLPFELGWFPFPTVDGGAGAADRRIRRRRRLRRRQGRPAGGGRLPRLHHQRRQPADVGDEQRASRSTTRPNDAVTDPNMQAVLDGLNNATFMQLFLDQFFTAEVGAPGQRSDRAAVRRRDVAARTPPQPSRRRPAADPTSMRSRDVGWEAREPPTRP